MDKALTHFELSSPEERQSKIAELELLDEECKSLKRTAKVYQCHGNSNLFFIADRDKVHSDIKLQIKKLTDVHKKLKQ